MNIVNIVNPTIWVNYHDLTVLPHWNHVLDVGTSSPNGLNLRLLKYYNLPIYILLNQMTNHHCMVLPETVCFRNIRVFYRQVEGEKSCVHITPPTHGINCTSAQTEMDWSIKTKAVWWFQPFFIFHNIWDNPSHWRTPSFFKMVKTTNQKELAGEFWPRFLQKGFDPSPSSETYRRPDRIAQEFP